MRKNRRYGSEERQCLDPLELTAFAVHLWFEPATDLGHEGEWRGRVTCALNGHTEYFRTLERLDETVLRLLGEVVGNGSAAPAITPPVTTSRNGAPERRAGSASAIRP